MRCMVALLLLMHQVADQGNALAVGELLEQFGPFSGGDCLQKLTKQLKAW